MLVPLLLNPTTSPGSHYLYSIPPPLLSPFTSPRAVIPFPCPSPRLRERLQRSLPSVLHLVGEGAGGGAVVLLVWSEAVFETVFHPLQRTTSELPLSAPVEQAYT